MIEKEIRVLIDTLNALTELMECSEGMLRSRIGQHVAHVCDTAVMNARDLLAGGRQS